VFRAVRKFVCTAYVTKMVTRQQWQKNRRQ